MDALWLLESGYSLYLLQVDELHLVIYIFLIHVDVCSQTAIEDGVIETTNSLDVSPELLHRSRGVLAPFLHDTSVIAVTLAHVHEDVRQKILLFHHQIVQGMRPTITDAIDSGTLAIRTSMESLILDSWKKSNMLGTFGISWYVWGEAIQSSYVCPLMIVCVWTSSEKVLIALFIFFQSESHITTRL